MASLEERQMVHQNVLRHFIQAGRAPHYTEMAEALGIALEKARQVIRDTTTESPFSFAWITPDTDYIASWAPFSSQPNHHRISVDGVQKWYAQ
jgi:DNA-directed RNA polymerase specialized sigma subunit